MSEQPTTPARDHGTVLFHLKQVRIQHDLYREVIPVQVAGRMVKLCRIPFV